MRGKATCPKTYTFRAQDVYVSHSKRIRFRRKTYTFYSQYVYVSLGKAIRLALSPSKLPFSTERCTSPPEITFIPAHRTFQGTYPYPSRPHKKQYPKRCRRFGYLMDFLCWSLYARGKVILARGELRSSPSDGVTED